MTGRQWAIIVDENPANPHARIEPVDSLRGLGVPRGNSERLWNTYASREEAQDDFEMARDHCRSLAGGNN